MNISLNGVTLHVKDIQKSKEFYSKIPGAKLIHETPGQFALFQVGQGRLGLLQHGEGKFHMEFDSADLDAMYAQLRENGLEPESPPQERPWGQRDFLAIDPDGNMVEFGQMEAPGDWGKAS
jgi:catechol 2,3-dioxygenase-like lactoylglutathione lyase family enzyme